MWGSYARVLYGLRVITKGVTCMRTGCAIWPLAHRSCVVTEGVTTAAVAGVTAS